MNNKSKTCYRVDIYIGSDNETGKFYDVYLERVIRWANGAFPAGYTLIRGQGYWRGVSEESLLINALTDCNPNLSDSIAQLKRELCQEAIILTTSRVRLEVI